MWTCAMTSSLFKNGGDSFIEKKKTEENVLNLLNIYVLG